MKKYICDICGQEMPEERRMLIQIKRFDGEETFNIKCFDFCSYYQADICKVCESKLKESIEDVVSKIQAKDADAMECEHRQPDNSCTCLYSNYSYCNGVCSAFSRKENTTKCLRCDCKYYDKEIADPIEDDVCRLCFDGSLYTIKED